MIATKSDIEVQSTVEGNKVTMTFDESATLHLMNVMVDLYSDPELAIIREYSTNAYDSHVAVGQTRPIEVSLPSPLTPFLTIQDFGLGMDETDIEETYSKYGASTKRNTNDQSGLLGLGCKSALSYASQFTLVGVKNGIKTTVSISRDEDGAGSMTIVESLPTDDPNGVKVQIPIRRHNEIERKAKKFFSFWKPETVLVNGKEPAFIEGKKIGKDLIISSKSNGYGSRRTNYVVMGNVSYPVDDAQCSLHSQLAYGHSVVAFVPIGSVNFTPSREALQYTRRTKDALAAIKQRILDETRIALQKEVDAAPNPQSALRAAMSWTKVLANVPDNLSYRSQALPDAFSFVGPNRACQGESDWFYVSGWNSYKPSDIGKYPKLEVSTAVTGLIVSGYHGYAKFTARHKKKLLQYCEEKGITAKVNNFVMVDKVLSEMLVWVDADRFTNWETITAIKLPRNVTPTTGPSGRIPGSYDLYQNGCIKYGVSSDDIDISNGIYYYMSVNRNAYQKIFNEYKPGCVIVELTYNRVDKFERTFPEALSVGEGLKAIYAEKSKGITKEEYYAEAVRTYGVTRRLEHFDASRIPDPELKKLIGYRKGLENKKITNLEQLARVCGMMNDIDVPDPFKKYPLISGSSYQKPHEHEYLYISAVYNSKEN